MKYAGIPDKLLVSWLKNKEYLICSDEAEAVALMAGYYLATKKTGTVFVSADGFMNILNYLTSWIIPEGIPINLVISLGRQEPSHKVASDIIKPIIDLLKRYDAGKIHYQFIKK